jgi:putative nucleotidyltransferase with HDIG domain
LRTFFLRLAPPRTLAIPAYLATLLAGTGATVFLLVDAGYRIESPWAVGVLCAIAAVAERGRVRLNSTTELSISLLPMLFAAVAFGPLEAMIVGAASMLGGFRPPYMKWAVFTLSEAITGAGTALAAGLAASLATESIGTIAAATLVGAFAAQLLDAVFASMTLYLRGTGRVRDYSHTVLPVIVASVPLYTPVVAVLVIAYQDVSPWTLPLFLTPALAAQRLFAMYQEQRRLAEDLSTANEALEEANLSFAAALVATLDARDQYTAGHSAAVAIYSRDIAARMGLSEAAQQEAHLAGLVHDIGKIGLPPGLLEKEGPLTLEERRVMQQHSEIGEGILAKVATYDRIAAIVRHHHERVDGHGYPDGLPEVEIPSISRIIAVADAYNAMTSDRPYREAMPSRVARMRLAQAVGSQFDTSVVAAFEAILATADESYRLGMRADFDFSGQRAVAVEETRTEIAGVA